MLCLAWIFAFLLSLPQSFIFRVVEPPGMTNFKQCTPIWTILGYKIDLEMSVLIAENRLTEASKAELIQRFKKVVQWERAYNMAHLLFVFWIPTLIIAGSYVTMLCILNSFFSVSKSFRSRMSMRRPRIPKSAQKAKNSTLKNGHPLVVTHQLSNGSYTSQHDDKNKNDASKTPRHSTSSTMNCITESESSKAALQKFSTDHSTDQGDGDKSGAVKVHKSFSTAESKKSGVTRNKWVAASISSPPVIKYDENANSRRRNSDLPLHSFAAEQPLIHTSKPCNSLVGKMALKRIAKARQKTKRQAALILMAYLTFWTPYNLLAVLNAFSSNEGVLKEIATVTLPFLNSMIVMNPIVNPIIYGLYKGRRSSIS